MPRYKPYDYAQSILVPVEFDKQILPGTLEHAICHIVDEKLDLSHFEDRYKNDKTGAPAYDPRILLKIVLFAYSRGVISSRGIEQMCQDNVVMKALTADQAPDFTTIAWFVRSMADEIVALSGDLLVYCHELGLLGGTFFALDGCKMRSNASKKWSGTFSDLKKKREKLIKTMKFVLKQHRENDRKTRGSSVEKKIFHKRIKRMKRKISRIDRFLESERPKEKTRGGEKKSNLTDNESAKMKTSKGVIQGYNGMALVDSRFQVVVHAEAFGSGQEHVLLKPMIEGAKKILKHAGMWTRSIREMKLIADTGSFSEENLKLLAKEKINAYIPDQQFRSRDPRFSGRERHRPVKDSLYTKEDFRYRRKTNDFVCPAGNILKYYTYQKFNNTEGRVYRALQSKCKVCPQREKCLRSANTRQRSLYVIEKYFNRNYSEEMIKKIDTPEGRRIYSMRMGIVEPVFGNITSSKGMDRFTLRTKRKVNAQWGLYCMVHNAGKIYRYGP